ncbi:hypothetical protein AX14_006707 [Amanita brunnescens Koide BX004]|nr:hypothetical protein AX14_006707 [Amanita brunnescens Koide BX004]
MVPKNSKVLSNILNVKAVEEHGNILKARCVTNVTRRTKATIFFKFSDSLTELQVVEPELSTPSPSAISMNVLQAIAVSKAAHANALDIHLKKTKNPLHTTAGLNQARASTAATAAALDRIQIHIEVCVKGSSKRDQMSMDPSFGKWGRPWAKEAFISKVLDDSLATVNLTWEKERGISLIRDEVELRFSQNRIFLPGTQNLTVGEIHEMYMTGDFASIYVTGHRSMSIKGPTLFLELYVDKLAFKK